MSPPADAARPADAGRRPSRGRGVDPRLQRQGQGWDVLARLNPFDSVLARFDRPGEWAEAEFFLQGEHEIRRALSRCERHGLPLRYGRALDFGCGLGRLSRALAFRFQECVGTDISEAMLERARELNRHVGNLSFVRTRDSLSPIADASVDFAYTARVLQHVPQRRWILRYLEELVRVLRPGGVLAAQMPTHIPWINRVQPRARLYGWLGSVGVDPVFLYRRLGLTPMRMLGMPEDEVVRTLERSGARVSHVERREATRHEYASATYFVVRDA